MKYELIMYYSHNVGDSTICMYLSFVNSILSQFRAEQSEVLDYGSYSSEEDNRYSNITKDTNMCPCGRLGIVPLLHRRIPQIELTQGWGLFLFFVVGVRFGILSILSVLQYFMLRYNCSHVIYDKMRVTFAY
jgi:hypothetical protein